MNLSLTPAYRRLPRLRWLWVVPLVSAIVVGAGAGWTLRPHRVPIAQSQALLHRAVLMAAQPTAYSGTSELTYTQRPPAALATVAHDVGGHAVHSSWAIADATHWWVKTRVLAPYVERETQTAVATGDSAVWYRGIRRSATRYSLPDSQAGSSLFAQVQADGGLPLGTELQQYLDQLTATPGLHASVIRSTTVRLPRTQGGKTLVAHRARVVRISPAVGSSSCTTSCSTPTSATGYGYVMVTIEPATGIVLRYAVYDVPTNGTYPVNLVYHVTSLQSTGPTAQQLAYTPPVTPVDAGAKSGASTGTAVGGSLGMAWRAPPGMLQVPTPQAPSGSYYTSCGSGSTADPQGIAATASVLFVDGFKAGATKGRICTKPFVYVQEVRRVSALPSAPSGGTRHLTGTCTAYTGTYPDGLHWLAFSYRQVAVHAVSDSYTPKELTSWAAEICT
jgi:hypothetical protein